MLIDIYVRSRKEALDEIQRRRFGADGGDMIHRIVESPYGGYRVHSMSPDLAIDFALDDVGSDLSLGGRRHYG